ncbi:Ig-like domain-containing protein [Flavobacterium selenitireducens]|uniref:Ig-like domain-containing protein n=1 Tax=Flavobacterium selenitireducens TaxID=2722704 RepID=UPI00168B63A8|nr:T9SS sorting signal type C domain-containing protein [Flavobacterium selenitireducens]MBD3581771.1 T9SS sorting signal type C domain-containing protein [Flavobacterium selenitireducens]
MKTNYSKENSAEKILWVLLGVMIFLFVFAAKAQCPGSPPGNPAFYPADSWRGYVYSGLDTNNPPQNAFQASTYRGYVTQSEQFDWDLVNAAPTASTVCGSYPDSFSIRYRMRKNFASGYYLVTIGGDDGVRLSIDGGSTWVMSDWNYHSYQTTTATIYLNGSTDMVLESYDQGGQYHVSFSYSLCPNPSTAPTAITGTTAICAGNSTTLFATGGNISTNGVYQWGTGTVGNNVIAGATGSSITVSPATTTTYWVRRIDPAPCTVTTTAVSQQVTVTAASTAPTSISGNTTICLNNSTTLTATGGTHAPGSVYEWGTGSVIGSNTISGESGASITVSPNTTTTYWVRRINAGNCGRTTAVTVNVNVVPPAGDQVSYGNNAWTGYVYSTINGNNPPTNAFTSTYRGYITQPEQFDMNLGAAALTGANLCEAQPSNFAIRFKMNKVWMAGYYTFTVGGDDGYRFSMDGGATWVLSNWADHSYQSSQTASIFLSGSRDFVIEFYERNGDTRVTFSYVACTNYSTAPTSISGSPSLCNTDGGVTLNAVGGNAANGVQYVWGTGNVIGNNIFNNNGGQSIYVNPNTTTTYWVRRYDPTCNLYTDGVTAVVYKGSTGPWSISGAGTVCANTTTTLTAQGGTPGTGSVYQWGTGNTPGQNVIAGATGATVNVSPAATTTYWVRLVDQGTCPGTNAVFYTLNTYVAPTAPTSITGTSPICAGAGGTTLYAQGATLGSNGQYQWGTGATVGSNAIGGVTSNNMYINPTATTTYWVRAYDPVCNRYTTGVTYSVTVATPSTTPTTLTASSTNVCSGANVTLTASGGTVGTGSVYNWGTGYTVGQNVISGQTGASIVVNPTVQTVYWVRRVDPAPCNTQTQGPTIVINVTTLSSGPTSLSATSPVCSATQTTLTASGATLGSNGQYQFGTGNTPGNNVISTQNGNTFNVNPTITTTYWVRTIDNGCATTSAAVFFTVTVHTASTNVTSVTGLNTICLGSSTTLTANGGALGTTGSYQWGTGTVGNNVITGETGVSITVSPTATTTYWVRRRDESPCNTTSGHATRTITIVPPAAGPTSINGAPSASACSGSTYTLTAVGGSGSNTFQWGTGTVGTNIIAGQTGATINVSPTVTTTYWVRRALTSPCSGYSSEATTTINITAPAGNPTVFGANQWNVYGYSTGDINLATAVYAGYYVSSDLNIDTQNGTNSWNNQNSPSSAAGWVGCPIPVDNFTFVYKRRGFTCGTYTLALANWDDQVRVFVDGDLVFSCDNWSGGGGCNNGVITGSFNLSTTSTIEVRVRENAGGANLKLDFTKTDIASTAPTAVNGGTTSCGGASVTLTATGGTTGTNGTFQWGTGTVGSNIITGETAASITVTPSVTTTYWVRRRDALCGLTTAPIYTTITVGSPAVAGTLNSPSTIICRNAIPQDITLSGHTGNVVKWQYATNSAFTAGVTDIGNTNATLTSAQIGNVPATRYFRAVVQNAGCPEVYTAPVVITILPTVVYNGTWSGTPTSQTPITVSANLNITSTVNACACQVTNNAVITVQPNANLIVQREIIVEQGSNIVVENSGSIVQVEDDAVNLGPATIKRNTAPMKGFDFTYWSSPVHNWTLFNLSPLTRFDKYYSFNPATNSWITHLNGNESMAPGRGYIVRAPAGWSLTNATHGVYNATFTGIMNSGVVSAPLTKGAGTFNLLGNPYPSAIDIDLFITDPANAGLVNGTIYLWTHNTAVSASIPGNAQYNYTADDYAKYNLTGGVKTASAAVSGGVTPTGKVASGQGFFIETKPGLANGNYLATFRNAMRVAGQNNEFFKPAANASTAITQTEGLEKHRFWLNFYNNDGAYDEMLVGYIQNATNEMDRLFDGPVFNGGNFVSLYTLLGDSKLSIQGRALPFDASDVIPVGYKSSVAGTFTIALENFDGLFAGQAIYLLDKTDMSYHNLSEGSYSFTTATGTFNSRFEIHFQNGSLGEGEHTPDANSVYIVKVDKHIEISSGNYNMAEVQIFDLTGKKIYDKNLIDTTLFSTKDLNVAAQVLIVKVTLDNDAVITKKVIMY